jgi:Fe-S cluster biogenesis protein NfuA
MSTETDEQNPEDELRERITNFLRRNFPQIQMHGGSAAIQDLDTEEGSVTIQLGGACSGCGISPMTIQAIKTRMTKEIPEIDTVHASTGMDGQEGMAGGVGGGGGMSPSFPGESGGSDAEDDEGPEAPF